MGWTLVALTADSWNIKREMFSLREKIFAFLKIDYIIARPTVAAAQHTALFQRLLIFPDRSHTLLPALSSPITVWVRKSKQGGTVLWSFSCKCPLRLSVLCVLCSGPCAGRTKQVGGVAAPRCAWRIPAHPAQPCLLPHA